MIEIRKITSAALTRAVSDSIKLMYISLLILYCNKSYTEKPEIKTRILDYLWINVISIALGSINLLSLQDSVSAHLSGHVRVSEYIEGAGGANLCHHFYHYNVAYISADLIEISDFISQHLINISLVYLKSIEPLITYSRETCLNILYTLSEKEYAPLSSQEVAFKQTKERTATNAKKSRKIFKLHKNSVRPMISDFVVLRNKKCTIDTSRIPVVLLKIPSGYPPLELPKVPAIIGDVLKPVRYDNSKQPGKQPSHASESLVDSIFINKRLVHRLSLGPQIRIVGSLRVTSPRDQLDAISAQQIEKL
ncbi:hypothetical protein GQX74_011535 [Glossina fuscipes]|nr:hypothetical protein GQX74_011535 [Glossina fuscipes]